MPTLNSYTAASCLFDHHKNFYGSHLSCRMKLTNINMNQAFETHPNKVRKHDDILTYKLANNFVKICAFLCCCLLVA